MSENPPNPEESEENLKELLQRALRNGLINDICNPLCRIYYWLEDKDNSPLRNSKPLPKYEDYFNEKYSQVYPDISNYILKISKNEKVQKFDQLIEKLNSQLKEENKEEIYETYNSIMKLFETQENN